MPKLPADLPENWTQGQTISPNGTEVGLTEKHGYNYLMKQVNDTQTEVNNINTALTDVAQQATVDEINNKIGTESDADTQPTLFGRLAQLKKVLLEKLAEVITKITGIDNKIGTSSDTSEDETLFGKISDVSKKVQDGDTLVYIPSTNIKKTLVDSEITRPKVTNNALLFLGYFKALHTGVIRIDATCKIGTPPGTSTSASINVYSMDAYSGNSNLRFGSSTALPKHEVGDTIVSTNFNYNGSALGLSNFSREYTEKSCNLCVLAGNLYTFNLYGSSDYPIYCNNFTISYDEVEESTL